MRGRYHWSLVLALSLVVALGYGLRAKSSTGGMDHAEYLRLADNLFHQGHYAYSPDSVAADGGAAREPGYPVLVAAVMAVDATLAERAVACVDSSDPGCRGVYRRLAAVHAALLVLAGVVVFATLRGLTGRWLPAWLGWAYIVFNFQITKAAHLVKSDDLALLLAAVSGLLLMATARRARWGLAAGAALALLALTKTVFLYFSLLLMLGGILTGVIAARRGVLVASLAVAIGFAPIVGGWAARNHHHFGSWALTDSRGSIALSGREAYVHMTTAEYGLAWLAWTRGFGDSLMTRHFPRDLWWRLDLYAPGGFYDEGYDSGWQRRAAQARQAGAVTPAEIDRAITRMVLTEIAANWPMYLATLAPLFYRGLWVDEYILLGLPALVWLVLRAWRRRDWASLAVLAPGLFSLLFYPAVSNNMPRLQFAAAPALAIAGALAVDAAWLGWRQRRRPAVAAAPAK